MHAPNLIGALACEDFRKAFGFVANGYILSLLDWGLMSACMSSS